jgi:flagellar biosynthetic protein FliR
MGFPILQQEQILLFTLIFLRIGAMLIMIPVLGERTVPARVKAGLTLLVSLLVFQSVQTGMPNIPADSGFFSMVAAMVGEILIGIIIGFTAKIIFSGIQFAGDMIGMQMGFSIVNVIDPLSSTQVSIFSEFQYLIAVLVYLSVDGHHLFILAIVDSYRMVSPFEFHFSGSLMQSIFMFSGVLFTTAVKVSAPVMAVLLFTNVALAIVARTVPQINVFIVGFPLQIAAGLLAVGLTVPIFVKLVQRAITGIGTEVYGLLRLM